MPPTQVRSKRSLQRLYQRCSAETQAHFEQLPSLLDNYPLEVSMGYAFHRLELGQNMALYCGVVKIYRANAKLAHAAISSHITRKRFGELYRTVFDVSLPNDAMRDLESAAKTRDLVIHGVKASDDRMRNAIGRALEFADAVNDQLEKKYQFRPCSGYWKGFAGRLKKLDTRTTRFMLKGMGFPIS